MTTGPSPQELKQTWLAACLKMRSDLRFDVRDHAQGKRIVLEDAVRGKFFQLGSAEYQLIRQFDGQRNLAEILAGQKTPPTASEGLTSAAQINQSLILSEDQGIQVAQWLAQNNLAYMPQHDNSKRIDEQAQQLRRSKILSLLNPLSFKVRLFNPTGVLNRLVGVGALLFSYWFLALWLLLALISSSIIWSEWKAIGISTAQIFADFRWLWLIVAWVALKVVHELGHGLACRKFGGEVPEAGVVMILFTPMAYVNVTSMWRFPSRWQRILVSSAGIYVELFVSFLALLIWQYGTGLTADLAFQVFLMASLNTIFFNANPLMRFDGYFVLSDLLQIPNLYPKSLGWLSGRFKSLFFGVPMLKGPLRGRERWVFPVYGILAWCWKVTIGISLIVAASVLFHGAGVVLAAAAFLIWYAFPAWKHWCWYKTARDQKQINYRRLSLSLVTTASLLIGVFQILHAPTTKSAPAIVQFADEQVLRAESNGLVKAILVTDGQKVQAGEVLLVLENPELWLQVFELEQQIHQSIIYARIKTHAKALAEAQAETERQISLKKQLAEKQFLLAGLTVKAPADGVIFRRGLDQLLGKFLEPGDELFSFAKSEQKEVLVSIDQRDWDSIQVNQDQALRIAFPGQAVMQASIGRLHPRASVTPPHLSLVASHGGSLPVKPSTAESQSNDSSNSLELLSPRFSIQLKLDETQGQQLIAGQRGAAFFVAKRQSLGSYLYLSIADWFEEKLKFAKQASPF